MNYASIAHVFGKLLVVTGSSMVLPMICSIYYGEDDLFSILIAAIIIIALNYDAVGTAFGAIISGAFAVLIALGSGGFGDAVIVLAVILVAQNVVQTIVQTKLTEGRLEMHPIVIFGSTIAGGALFGLLAHAVAGWLRPRLGLTAQADLGGWS